MNPEVLVALSIDLPGITRLPRILARHNIRVSVLSSSKFLLSRSRLVHKRFECEPGAQSTAEALKYHLNSPDHTYDLVVPGDDDLLEYMCVHADELNLNHVLPCPDNLDLHWSKTAFATLCENEGLPIPRSFTCTTQADTERAVRKLGYPIIFKESVGFGGFNVHRFSSETELQAYFARRTHDGPWLVQEFIDGGNVTVDAFFNHGHAMAWSTAIIEHTSYGPFSSSTARRFVPVPEAEPIIETLGRITGMHGFCGIDFIRSANDGKLHLLEINFRPTVGHSISYEAGVDLGAAAVAAFQRQTMPHQPQRTTPTIHYFPEDVNRCISERDISNLLAWIVLPSRIRLIPWDEPRILLRFVNDIAVRMVKGVGKYMFKPTRLIRPIKGETNQYFEDLR